MKQPKAPCCGCEVREPACQPHCEKYGQYIREYENYKSIIRAAKAQENNMDDFKFERVIYSKQTAGR